MADVRYEICNRLEIIGIILHLYHNPRENARLNDSELLDITLYRTISVAAPALHGYNAVVLTRLASLTDGS